jgi:dTDP-4-amino-4,6-dideoxygalactose transaminase
MPFSLAFSSATNALSAIAMGLELRPEEEVIVAPYNWGSSIGWLVDMTPATVKIAEASANLNLSPDSVKELITPHTRAVWACDYEGIPHDMHAIRTICDDHGLFYVADAARSFGSFVNEKPASSLADALVLSFGSGKPIDAGEGGMLISRHSKTYEKALRFQHPYRSIIEIGSTAENEFFPINGRMSPLAAIVIENLIQDWPI